MGLITLVLLGAMALFYLGKSLENPPAFIAKTSETITENLDRLAMIGVVYGLIAALLTPLFNDETGGMLVRLFANLMLVVLALPFAFERIVEKYRDSFNATVLKECRSFIDWTHKQQKVVAYAAVVIWVLLFAILFR